MDADIVGRLEDAIARCGRLRPGDRLLVAVSGGQDSTALLLALGELRAALGLYLEVGHVNHGLRGHESDGDEEFVRALGRGLAVPVHVVRLGLAVGPAPEERAREGRLDALRQMTREHGLERIALGHTGTDRAETVLMNILRGTGLEGLAAMAAVSGDLVRPLLGLTRSDTEAYCLARNVTPRYDSTNADQGLLRNRVRLSLMPLLEREYQPGAEAALVRLAGIAEAELEWTAALVEESGAAARTRSRGRLSLSLAALAPLPKGLRRRVLRQAALDVRGHLRNLSLEHIAALDELVLGGRTGQRAELPGLRAERSTEALILRAPGIAGRRRFQAALPVPGQVEVPQAGLVLSARRRPPAVEDSSPGPPLLARLDAAVIGAELVIRSPRPGDRLVPLGMSGTKKLSDLLADRKIARLDREGVLVAATTEGEIVWVVGHRISERAKITPATAMVAEIEARPLGLG